MRRSITALVVWLAVVLPELPSNGEEGGEAERLAALAERVPTVALEDLKRGQKGYGLSVFAGTEPERFEVEVLGLVRKTTPELSYLLTRLSEQDLERSGVVAGMSGSPVYFDGRLAGAVSFSYLYGLDPIAGITPIDSMRAVSRLEKESSAGQGQGDPVSVGSVALEDLIERSFPPDRLEQALTVLGGDREAGSNRALMWSASGFGTHATELLRSTLGVTTGGGWVSGFTGKTGLESRGSSDGGKVGDELQPGSAVAAVLVGGDLQLAAHGTITDRWGDDVVAFGHPVFSFGPINIPMAVSEVVTVIPSVANSFKVSNATEIVGAFVQDREAGAHGRVGEVAPRTPLAIKLRGLTTRDYAVELANLPQLRPVLLAVSTLGVVSAGSYTSRGLDLHATFDLGADGDLEVKQSFEGDQATIDCVLYLLSFASYLENNDLRRVDLRSIEVELTQVAEPSSAILRSAFPSKTVVAPGERITLTLDQQAYRGDRFRSHVEVTIPTSTPDGQLMVLVGDGTSMDALRLGLEMPSPESFEQVLRLLRSLHSRRELEVFVVVPRLGLATAGEVLPDLPGSVRSILGAGDRATIAPLAFAIAKRGIHSSEHALSGAVRIDLRVQREPDS